MLNQQQAINCYNCAYFKRLISKMSKISKIQSMKQEKKYRNETINILNHMNSKIGAPAFNDKSFNSFKNIKPEIQSSRLTRHEPSKASMKFGANYYMGYSRDKEKKIDSSEIMEKMSSKSLESRHGSIKTYRIQNEKTKKNSYNRLPTDACSSKQCNNLNSQTNRFKILQQIFKNSGNEMIKIEGIDQSSSGEKNKNLQNWNVPTNYISMKKIETKENNRKHSRLESMIENLNKKFTYFQAVVEGRKSKMIYDELDSVLSLIMRELQSNFSQIVLNLMQENDKNLLNFERGLQIIIAEHEEQMLKERKKVEQIKQFYVFQIQEMMVKSLYTTDKINELQKQGVLHFENIARQLDCQEYKDICLSQKNNMDGAKSHFYHQISEEKQSDANVQKILIKSNSNTGFYWQESIGYDDSGKLVGKGNCHKAESKPLGHGCIKKIR